MNQGGHYDGIEVAGIVLYSFLENSSNVTFASKLCSLKKQLLAPKHDEGELQTDGNNFGRVDDRALDSEGADPDIKQCLQKKPTRRKMLRGGGFCSAMSNQGSDQEGAARLACSSPSGIQKESNWEVANEETFRKIGARLAVIGDKMSAEIEHRIVNNLAQQFMMENVSGQVVTQQLSDTVNTILARMPRDMDQEKAMLVVAMTLAKKVANVVPSLLQQVFSTTVNYINQNLHDYVNNLGPEN